MKLTNTHKRSCLLDACAFILERRPLQLIKRLGHTGWDNGFHTQEMIEIMLDLGWAVTLIERKPISLNPVSGNVREIHFGDRSAEERFTDRIWNSTGVLTGDKKGIPHAVAWQFNRIWDPASGSCYPHIEADLGYPLPPPEPRFTGWNFLRMDRIL